MTNRTSPRSQKVTRIVKPKLAKKGIWTKMTRGPRSVAILVVKLSRLTRTAIPSVAIKRPYSIICYHVSTRGDKIKYNRQSQKMITKTSI